MREKISAFIITKNEEDKIERCLSHLTWVDELIVLDSYSTDKTIEIAKKFTKKVFKKTFEGYGSQKQAAIDKCSNAWILEVDADEIIPNLLREEIEALLHNPEQLNKNAGYTITRQEYFLKKPLMTSKIVRLYRKDAIKYYKEIHEVLNVNGSIGRLKQNMIHEADNYDTIAKRIDKINEYTKKEAEIRYKEKKWSVVTVLCAMIVVPWIYFIWMYICKHLIFKGYRGIIWSFLTSYYHFLIYAKIYEYIYKEKHSTEAQWQSQ
jgi:glycosyltransferase involved in cell wall biosynthesis